MGSSENIKKPVELQDKFGFDSQKATRVALNRMIGRLVWVVVILGGIGMLASANRVYQIGWHSDIVLDISFFAVAVFVLALRNRLGVQWTAGILAGGLAFYAFGGLWGMGLISLAPVVLVTALVFVGVFFGIRMVFVFLGLCVAAYALVGWAHVRGWSLGVPSPLDYLRSVDAWVAKVTGFAVFAAVVAIVVDSLRVQLFKVLRDLSQRAQDLAASEQRYRMLAENIEDALVVRGLNDEILYASPSAFKIFGMTQEEAGKKRLESLMTKESGERARLDYEHYKALAERGPIVVPLREYEYVRQDGSHFWCELRPRFLYDDNGRVASSLVVCRDITDRKRAEKEKAGLQERLTHAEKMESIGLLAGGIAHDFNNLLTGVQGAAELLLRGDLPEPKQKLVQLILSSSRHASDLTRNLLTFARKAPMDIKPQSLTRILEEVVLLLKSGLEKRIKIECSIEHNLAVMADEAMLKSALINLGLNARDSIHQTGVIRFDVEPLSLTEPKPCWGGESLEPGDYMKIAVADDGVGMSKEVLERIFNPFFTTKSNGTGLGLAAVFGAVTAQGGCVDVESALGQGSRFSILLPAAELPEKSLYRAEKRKKPRERRLEVLVVDDEESVRTVLTELLGSLGHGATCCVDGPDAVKALDSRPDAFDLAIVDMSMPRMSGREVLEEIRRRRPDLYVILSSGHPLEKDLEAARQKGGVGFLAKPYTLEALAEAIADAPRDSVG